MAVVIYKLSSSALNWWKVIPIYKYKHQMFLLNPYMNSIRTYGVYINLATVHSYL